MNIKNLTYYREQLLALRRRLRGDVVQMAGAASVETTDAVNGETSAASTQLVDSDGPTVDREFTLRLLGNGDGMLEQVQGALERMEDGLYGVCAECKKQIPQARLCAIPYATRCVKCTSLLESNSVPSSRS